MIDNDHGRIVITICSGTGPVKMVMDVPGLHGDMADHGKSKDHGKGEMPCVFSGLSAATTGAIDPIQLAALLVFVLAAGLAVTILPGLLRCAYLRPPLRGPPARL